MKMGDRTSPSRLIVRGTEAVRLRTKPPATTDLDLDLSSPLRPQTCLRCPRAMLSPSPTPRARGMHPQGPLRKLMCPRPARPRTSEYYPRGRPRIPSACVQRLPNSPSNPRSTIEFLPLQIPYTRPTEASSRPRRDMRPPLPPSPSPSSLLRRTRIRPPAVLDSTNSQAWLRRRCKPGFRTTMHRQRSSMPHLGGTGPSTSHLRSSTLPRRTDIAALPHQE